jgi:putative ABC transport system permease protein
MLASITGRIREIGIRKSVGATTQDIFIQILVESVVLAVLGGLIGLIVSPWLVRIISHFSATGNEPVITAAAVTFAFLCSVTIGVVAGLVPAFKGARLHPIGALKYE